MHVRDAGSCSLILLPLLIAHICSRHRFGTDAAARAAHTRTRAPRFSSMQRHRPSPPHRAAHLGPATPNHRVLDPDKIAHGWNFWHGARVGCLDVGYRRALMSRCCRLGTGEPALGIV
eukprot:3141191-Rhodomonas_salina.6